MEPARPFLWASGWKSPVYCDNRLILSYPELRSLVRDAFCDLARSLYPSATLIAGVATGAIAHGALVADQLGLPFAYVRPAPKAHGLAGRIEGKVTEADRVVVIEDLISTGRSSISAVQALRSSGCGILGMLAIFTYGFDVAAENFLRHECELHTLTNYNVLISIAVENGYVSSDDMEALERWRGDPEGWME